MQIWNFTICSVLYKNNTLKISHSYTYKFSSYLPGKFEFFLTYSIVSVCLWYIFHISRLRISQKVNSVAYCFYMKTKILADFNSCIIVYLPSKHSSWWRRTEDVLNTSWKRLQRNIFLLKTSSRHNCKTSFWRRLEDVLKRSWRRLLANTSWRRLKDVLEDEKLLRCRRLGKQEMFAGFKLIIQRWINVGATL